MSSRNRPRGSFAKDDISDEVNLWNSIVDKIKRCAAINRKYEENAKAILVIEEQIPEDETPTLAQIDELDKLYRLSVKYAEEEVNILHEEPEELIKNLDTLISVRAALEHEPAKPATSHTRVNKMKRRLEPDAASDAGGHSDAATPVPPSRGISKANSRSGSVAAASVKVEPSEPEVKPAVAIVPSDKKEKFPVGSLVFYRHKGKGADGEGILCTVTNVLGEGKHRRYEVQDNEPETDEHGNEAEPFKATVNQLIAIPPSGAGLPELSKGKHVVAVYPQTTTFYKAEMVGLKKGGQCRLRFEGEEEKGTEQDVERRFVLDKT